MFSIKQSGQWWSWMTLKGHFSYVSIFPSLNCADYKKPWNTCSSWAFLFVVCIIIMYVAGIVYVIINIIQLHKWQPCVMMSPTRLVWRIHWLQLQWWICSLFFFSLAYWVFIWQLQLLKIFLFLIDHIVQRLWNIILCVYVLLTRSQAVSRMADRTASQQTML